MIICGRCRTENEDGERICVSCRAYLGWSRTPGRSSTPPAESGAAHPPATAAPADRNVPVESVAESPVTASSGSPAAEGTLTPSAEGPAAAPPPASRVPPPPPRDAADSAGRRASRELLESRVPPPPPGNRAGAEPAGERADPPARRPVATVQPGKPGPATPRIPERTLGVVVAAQPARLAPRAPVAPPSAATGPPTTFEAVSPQETTGAASRNHGPTPSASTGVHPPPRSPDGRGGPRCHMCGQPVAGGRRFCRCGASVAVHTQAPPAAPLTAHVPWWRRPGELLGGGRDFRRAMRSANGGVRAAYDVTLSMRSRLVRASLLLGTLGIGVSQLGPWGGDLRAQVTDRVDRLLPRSYTALPVGGALTDPATPVLSGYDVGFAVDGDLRRAWAARWQPPGDTGAPCDRAGGSPALLVTFRQPVSVDRLTVNAGLAEDSDERLRQARPRQLDVRFSDGTCAQVDLADVPTAQPVKVHAQLVTRARVVVVDAYPARDRPKVLLMSLSELTFESRD